MPVRSRLPRFLFQILVFSSSFYYAAGQTTAISGPAYQDITSRVLLNQQGFSLYSDADSGYNHGFFSDFPNGNNVVLTVGCVDDSSSATGCSTNPNALDRQRGTVLSITLTPPFGFSGVNLQEPQDYPSPECVSPPGIPGCGYDLAAPPANSTAPTISFDARSPTGGSFVFGVGPCVTPSAISIPLIWTPIVVNLGTLIVPGSGGVPCQPEISELNVLFGVQAIAPSQGTILLDNVIFNPVPARQLTTYSFPLSTQTFGITPLPAPNTADRPLWPIPPDQVNRNATSVYESSLSLLALLARGAEHDVTNAKYIADSFHAALYNDNHGDPIPASPSTSQGCYGGSSAPQCGLHDDYESGDLLLNSTQPPPEMGQAGDVRLAGFSLPPLQDGSYSSLCGSSHFCLVNDGASGGNNAYAMLGMIAAYRQSKNVRYLSDALTIGNWIQANLQDTSNTGYGGYFVGYNAGGTPKTLSYSKSVENNADIFAAFTELAGVEQQLGNPAVAAVWTGAAQSAADFVCSMYDEALGGFDAGTLAVSQQVDWGTPGASYGVCPDPSRQSGDDVPNACDFLDSNTFTTLALAGRSQCGASFDWRKPIQHVLATFVQPAVTTGGRNLQGFNIVPTPSDNLSTGIAWEFTGQVIQTMRYVDQLYGETNFNSQVSFYLQSMAIAQTSDPFGDGQGLVASTLQNGPMLPPLDQCLATPYQCIPERVGLAATVWGIFAERGINPESFASPCDVLQAGTPGVGDVQQIINEVLGVSTPVNDINFDGVVNVVDVQIVVNGVLGLGCSGS